MPEPTVKVRMEEGMSAKPLVCADAGLFAQGMNRRYGNP